MDEHVERTMWCPKRCDLLVMEAKPNPYEFKFTLKGTIFYFMALILVYIFLNEPPLIFDNLPLEIPAQAFLLGGLFFALVGLGNSKGIMYEYNCQSCKGVLFDSKAIEKRILKREKREAIIQLLNESTEMSDLQCPSCSKDMNSIVILYFEEHQSNAKNPLLEIAIEVAVDSIFGGTKEMKIEGCKNCNILWFDKFENNTLTSNTTRLSSDEKVQE